MINWVPNKSIDKGKVNDLLELSIKTNSFTNNGPNVQLLEKIIREKLCVDSNKSVIVINNGSAAIHLLTTAIEEYESMKINWATQSFTFPPSAQCTLKDADIIDIDYNGGIDLNKLNKYTNGIIVTNIFGNVVDIDKYEKWTNIGKRFLIFDNAATPYTYYKNKNCINYGNGSTISFHHTKPIGFGEGGAIICDEKYEYFVRNLMNFGIKKELDIDNYWNKNGSNYKMSDISAVYIIQYLEKFDFIKNKHMDLYKYFKKSIENNKLLQKNIKLFPTYGDINQSIPSCICLLFENYNDNVRQELNDNGIFCRKYYIPLKKTDVAMKIFNSILCLPCTIEMDYNDIDNIINIILKNTNN